MIDLYINFDTNCFLLTEFKQPNNDYDLISDIKYLFGYCFTKNNIIKNRVLKDDEYNYIHNNRDSLSGIYFVICKIKDNISLILDPLVQYNLFYYINNESVTISNNIFTK